MSIGRGHSPAGARPRARSSPKATSTREGQARALALSCLAETSRAMRSCGAEAQHSTAHEARDCDGGDGETKRGGRRPHEARRATARAGRGEARRATARVGRCEATRGKEWRGREKERRATARVWRARARRATPRIHTTYGSGPNLTPKAQVLHDLGTRRAFAPRIRGRGAATPPLHAVTELDVEERVLHHDAERRHNCRSRANVCVQREKARLRAGLSWSFGVLGSQ